MTHLSKLSLRSFRGNQAALSPVSAALSGGLTALAVAIAAHQNQFEQVAAYTAGMSAAAIAAVLVSGGSTLSYVSGDDLLRASVRRMRHAFTAPSLLLISVAACLIYSRAADLPWIAVLLGGLTVCLNNLAELPSADMQRGERIILMTVSLTIARLVAIIALVVGQGYPVAMTLSTALSLVFLSWLGRHARTQRVTHEGLGQSLMRAYNFRLLALSLVSVAILRVPFIVAPLVAPTVAQAGAFTVLLSAQQSLLTFVTSGLYTIMAIRSKGRSDLQVADRMSRLERSHVIGALLLSLGLVAATPVVTRVFNVESLPGASLWWIVIVLAIAPTVANRAAQYRFLSSLRESAAVLILAVILVAEAIFVGVSLLLGGLLPLACSVLLSESVGYLWSLRERTTRREVSA